MRIRKIILLAGIVVLAVVFAYQLVLNGKNSIQEKTLEENPDMITVENAGASLVLNLSGEDWTIGENKYPVDSDSMNKLVNALKSIRILQTVSSSSENERYGLGDAEVIKVTASKNGKNLRSLNIGKNAVTSSQTYIQLDNNKNVLLVSGALHDVFSVTTDSLRDKTVIKFDSTSEISKVVSDTGKGNFVLEKADGGAAWTLMSNTETSESENNVLDVDKAASWVNSFSVLKATGFADNAVLSKSSGSLMLQTAEKAITLTVYEEVGADGADSKWYCKTSESPYVYIISQYSAANILKSFADIAKVGVSPSIE